MSEAKQQQVLALGRLGWSLRRIERATGVRRETAGLYLRAAGVGVRGPRCRGPAQQTSPPLDSASKPASLVAIDPGAADSNPASWVSTDSAGPAPAALGPDPIPARCPSASACEPWRDLIGLGLECGRDAMAIWQGLVDEHGFTAKYASVRRYVVKLRGEPCPEAHCVIVTAPGEEAQVHYGEGPMVRHPKITTLGGLACFASCALELAHDLLGGRESARLGEVLLGLCGEEVASGHAPLARGRRWRRFVRTSSTACSPSTT